MIFLLFQYNIEKKEDSDADEEDDEDDDFGGGPSKKPVDDDPVARKLDKSISAFVITYSWDLWYYLRFRKVLFIAESAVIKPKALKW